MGSPRGLICLLLCAGQEQPKCGARTLARTPDIYSTVPTRYSPVCTPLCSPRHPCARTAATARIAAHARREDALHVLDRAPCEA